MQIIKTERIEKVTRTGGAGGTEGAGLVKDRTATREPSPVEEELEETSENSVLGFSARQDNTDDDDGDDEKGDDDDDVDDTEGEINDETFTPAKSTGRRRTRRRRPSKHPPGANTKKSSSRLKLVKKAIAKVKRDRTSGAGDGGVNGGRGKPLEKPKCNKCDYVALSGQKLEQHVRKAHKDDTVYACSMCEYTCTWNREYYRHMKVHFTGPPYECDFEACDYVVDRIQPLLYHRMVSITKSNP